MAKDFETRREEAGDSLGRAKEKIGAGEGRGEVLPSSPAAERMQNDLAGTVTDHPFAAIGAAAVAGFLLAASPLAPRRFLRAALGTFAGRLIGERLASRAGQMLDERAAWAGA